MAGRKLINWDYIQPLYRVGALSNYEIAAQYSAVHKDSESWKTSVSEAVIRKQAKAKGWKKNLADRVKTRVRENLVRSSDVCANMSDEEVVHRAAEVGSDVVLRHREEIAALSGTENNLLAELDAMGSKTEDKTSLKDKTIILKNIAHVRAQRIALEREAYNLDDQESDADKAATKTRIIRRKTRDGDGD